MTHPSHSAILRPRARRARPGWRLLWCIPLSLAIAGGCATPEQVRATKSDDDAGQFVDAGGVNTYYIRKGRDTGDRPPLVLIHGFGASTFSYRHNIIPLAEDFAVYAFDLKGFGASEKPLWGYSLDQLRDHAFAFLDAVGLHRAVLVGTSMGGEIALRMALAQPERVQALVLIDSAGFLRRIDTPIEGRILSATPLVGGFLTLPIPLQMRTTRRVMARYLRKIFYDPAHVTPEVVDGYLAPLATLGGTNGLLARMRARDWGGAADRIPEITAPTLVVWGQDDALIPVAHAESFRKALPHARVIVLPRCGHNPQAEYPHIVNRAIADFLAPPSEITR